MFRFTARTLLELGSELISSDVIAFYELIKNGLDAGSSTGVSIDFNIILPWQTYRELSRRARVDDVDVAAVKEDLVKGLRADADYDSDLINELTLNAKSSNDLINAINQIYRMNSITVSDTGTGMDYNTLGSVFLLVGTGSRKAEVEQAMHDHQSETPYMGEKGLGRLSAMRLGNALKVITATQKETNYNILEIDWTEFDRHDKLVDDIDITPTRGPKKKPGYVSGTRIVISDLNSDWSEARFKRIAEEEFSLLYDPFEEIRQRPKIKLNWNGEQIVIPALDKNLLDHAHAKVSGKYQIINGEPELTYRIDMFDLGYEHPEETDVLTLNRTDLMASVGGKDSGIDREALESVGPFTFEAYWFNRRRLSSIDSIGDRKQVLKLQRLWTGIRLYRDGFRVFPYGEEDDDWLSLDRTALMSQGYSLNKIQFIGRVNIGRLTNPQLIDQTNREGLRETPEQRVLLRSVHLVVQSRLRAEMRHLDRQYKKQREKKLDSQDELKSIAKRAKTSIAQLRKSATEETRDTVDELKQTLFNLLEFSDRAHKRVEEVELDARQMIDLAGIGLLVEVVAHELARSSETALQNISALKRSDASREDVAKRLENLRHSMKSINKRLRILDPLSVSGRNRAETFALETLVEDTLGAHKNQFERHNIELILTPPTADLKVTAVKGYVVQVLENLISNSVYWLDLEVKSEKSAAFKPRITISFEDNPATIYFEDNGPGIHPEHKDKVFELFYSTKDVRRRRGLGLFIARDAAEQNGGALELDLDHINASGRLNRFIYTFSE